jgi:LmbE family N-acetylglucosaminyl deacetylase
MKVRRKLLSRKPVRSGTDPLRLLVIGAHPDDCEFFAGGLAAWYRRSHHAVTFVSVTDGGAGHHELSRKQLIACRKKESRLVSKRHGIEYEFLGAPDGALEATLALRQRIIRLIRRFDPDLVLTHRPNDYHPDHRATSMLVQDSSYLITVPAICPDVAALRRDPVICYLQDRFTRPRPFTPDVVISIDAVIDDKIDMLHCHASQLYEWSPWISGTLDQVPSGDAARRSYLRSLLERTFPVSPWRRHLARGIGKRSAQATEFIEAFEACEYGATLDERQRNRLFPMPSSHS